MKRVLRMLGVIAFLVARSGFAAVQSVADQPTEEHMTHEIRNELITVPQLTIFDHLAFKLDGSTVTLTGQVRNAFLKDSAEKVVESIDGVKAVNNQIEVLPALPNDDRIRKAVARAIFNDNRLFRYSMGAVPPIHIIVNRGHVRLEGVVDNQSDKDAAGLRANRVPGVFSVQNNLRVENST